MVGDLINHPNPRQVYVKAFQALSTITHQIAIGVVQKEIRNFRNYFVKKEKKGRKRKIRLRVTVLMDMAIPVVVTPMVTVILMMVAWVDTVATLRTHLFGVSGANGVNVVLIVAMDKNRGSEFATRTWDTDTSKLATRHVKPILADPTKKAEIVTVHPVQLVHQLRLPNHRRGDHGGNGQSVHVHATGDKPAAAAIAITIVTMTNVKENQEKQKPVMLKRVQHLLLQQRPHRHHHQNGVGGRHGASARGHVVAENQFVADNAIITCTMSHATERQGVTSLLQSMTSNCHTPNCHTFCPFLFYYSPKIVSFG